MRVCVQELGLAYRRVKADLYAARSVSAFKLLRYEENLLTNLKNLKRILESESFSELDSICRGYRIVPKSVECEVENDSVKVFARMDEQPHIKRYELRLVEDAPVDFHIIMQLWVDRLGAKLERCFSKCSYGNRLRMHNGKLNLLYPGSFKHYIKQYKAWHDGALDVIDTTLRRESDVVVMTADFTAFYHNLSSGFLLDEQFWRSIGIGRLTTSEQCLTRCVASMLQKWAESTPLRAGLPVGCSISAVLANTALTLLDRKIESLPGIVYYGRYVDDIILVVKRPEMVKRGKVGKEAFFRWLAGNVKGIVGSGDNLCYQEDVLLFNKDCNGLFFKKAKTKVFVLGGDVGIGYIKGLTAIQ